MIVGDSSAIGGGADAGMKRRSCTGEVDQIHSKMSHTCRCGEFHHQAISVCVRSRSTAPDILVRPGFADWRECHSSEVSALFATVLFGMGEIYSVL
jgi:hypothetical protein